MSSPAVPVLLALVLGMASPFGWAQPEALAPTVRMVRGHVVAVDPARRLVLLKHEEIPSLGMPEMQMEHMVPEGSAFPELAAGDKVRFAVVRVDGRYVVTRVVPLPLARRSPASPRDAVRSDP